MLTKKVNAHNYAHYYLFLFLSHFNPLRSYLYANNIYYAALLIYCPKKAKK